MQTLISTHAPAGGATRITMDQLAPPLFISTHAPAGGATRLRSTTPRRSPDFYSRPCGRGDRFDGISALMTRSFLLTPLREGRPAYRTDEALHGHFYSRPCGRGDSFALRLYSLALQFLLTPLREGRRSRSPSFARPVFISTHAPAGGATSSADTASLANTAFLLTPLREGRRRLKEKLGTDT